MNESILIIVPVTEAVRKVLKSVIPNSCRQEGVQNLPRASSGPRTKTFWTTTSDV
ncbi:MAG TPA: hypothetical protein PKA53_10260 [Sphingobacterium sp.]|nr:hypothetical protein [Sphingobacterium sp.]